MLDEGSLVQQRLNIPGLIATEVISKRHVDSEEVILLLHGYQQTGQFLMRKLLPALPEKSWVIAPSAPYPLPERLEGKYRVGYSWYFYDHFKEEYFIGMEIAISFLRNLLVQQGTAGLPLKVIGYSQGGYLAPFFANEIANVKQVIGIASAMELETVPSFRMDQIHGEKDEVVNPANALEVHRRMVERGGAGEFRMIPGVGHWISPEMVVALGEVLRKTF